MSEYYRPLVRHHRPRPANALPVAGGTGWFTEAVLHTRHSEPRTVTLSEIPKEVRDRLSAPRAPMAGLTFSEPRLMGILNVTPDSFSDGGQHHGAARALSHARQLQAEGAHIVDVGGESTRPGAKPVPAEAEIARIQPVISAVSRALAIPVSIDTRKSSVAEVAVREGAALVNDISGFTYDPMLARYCARDMLPVCVMHARGDPQTMQDNPQYDDLLLDIYDFLDAQIHALEALGLPRSQIMVDPGIGFGKNITHNLALLQNLSLFHGLGCVLLVGASRKGFIGKISGANPAGVRVHGSVAVALAAVQQGAHVLRVHDVLATAQALSLWNAVTNGHWQEDDA
ncbi:dihydropteroate synthase [Cognatishimia sp. F0-27]|uniref:dihydropteroate synthase n=1 Tax=Cognatishimia sp. F0-27 TaxID=2816855 RepID=UPI001D0CA469|nr:dihydropteroate synthase [Cognatishimia sp. F0-27]MCC1493643.1 dihydropteroate synthase [Cognatishimia sp. F0-27]